jgi:transposase
MPPHTVSHDLKACIPVLRYSGYSVKEICGILGIKKSLVYNTLQHHSIHGVCYNPNSCKCGRHHELTAADIAFIRSLISEHRTLYLDEIQEQLLTRRGTQISVSALMRTLCRLHFTNKDVSGHVLEQNIELHAIFMNQIADLVGDPNMLMFGDEAVKDEQTSAQWQGWSLRGSRCVQRKCFIHGKQYSIIPIITLDGIITYNIIEGSVTSERFLQFLQELVVSSFHFLSLCVTHHSF